MSYEHSSIKKILLGLAVVLLVGYALFNSRLLIQGPQITLDNLDPKTDTIISPEKTLYLKGTAENSSYITVNGRPISIDETGTFTEKLLLSSEMSIIDIYAKDKFGKETRKKVDVLYEGETPIVDYKQVAITAEHSASLSQTEQTMDVSTEVVSSEEPTQEEPEVSPEEPTQEEPDTSTILMSVQADTTSSVVH